jgi:hypothetical protein
MWVERTGDDPQQGGFSSTVGADESGFAALTHPEGDLVEQDSPIGQGQAYRVETDIPHR